MPSAVAGEQYLICLKSQDAASQLQVMKFAVLFQLQFICSAKVVISVFELDVLKPELLSNYGSVCETRQTNLISKYLLWIVLHPVALSVGGF